MDDYMVEYLSENIPDCIRKDVAKELSAQLNSPEVFHRLFKIAEDKEYFIVNAVNLVKKSDLKKKFLQVRLNNPVRKFMKFKKVEADLTVFKEYFNILGILGFDPITGAGGIDFNLGDDKILCLINKLRELSNIIKRQNFTIPYDYVQYEFTRPNGEKIYTVRNHYRHILKTITR